MTILGCGSAKPTLRHHTSSQLLECLGELYMIDCGEGTQQQLLRYNIHPGKLQNIFISHAHGDHCLGLVGMLSSWALNGRQEEVNIYVTSDFEPILQAQIGFFIHHAEFSIRIHTVDCLEPSVIFEDRSFSVTAFPLNHRVPCYGFLFKEKEGKRHHRKECIEQYGIPFTQCEAIRSGADFVTAEGVTIPNDLLTTPPDNPRSYAYVCDSRPVPEHADLLHGVDLLYHDSTYMNDQLDKACTYCHSTAGEAAQFAAKCDAGLLLLGHVSSRYESDEDLLLREAVEQFPRVQLADEGLQLKIMGQNGNGPQVHSQHLAEKNF